MAFDLLIRGGEVLDGSGGPPRRGDVGVANGRIAALGALADAPADRILEAQGLYVAPGFIDMHAHSDLALLRDGAHEAKIRQGVTLEVIGQDGLSYAPANPTVLEQMDRQLAGWNGTLEGIRPDWNTVGEYLDRLDRGIAVNAAYLVPHGTLRLAAVGNQPRDATRSELAQMRAALTDSLRAGAVGMSAGLTYTPGMYAGDDELIALCEVIAEHDGIYCPHHRGYGVHAMREYAACLAIARASGVRLHLAHCLLPFPVNAGRAPELMRMLDEARQDGVEVTLDSYPYTAGCSYLHAFLPGWVMEGGLEEASRRLRDPKTLAHIREVVEVEGSDGYHHVPVDWGQMVLSGVKHNRHTGSVGRSMRELAAETGIEPFAMACQLVLDEDFGATAITHVGNEENNVVTMRDPHHTVGSDAILVGQRPHPRAYGTFPRYLGQYVRDQGMLEWPEAIRRVTAAPASILGLSDRGQIKPGLAADLVCFDPRTISDTATFDAPIQYPVGIPHVVVNGVPAVIDGTRTSSLSGHSVRRF